MEWIKDDKNNPVIPVVPGTWKEVQTANPDLLRMRDNYFLYYRGQGKTHSDDRSAARIGVMTISKDRFDGKRWDGYSLTTPRIFSEDGVYYMVYAGSNEYRDYLYNFGVAVSKDLHHWKKYSGNPVFSRGNKGEWDEGAIWFGTTEKINDTYYMWYEGYGGGKSRDKEYAEGGCSQIGLARLKCKGNFLNSLEV